MGAAELYGAYLTENGVTDLDRVVETADLSSPLVHCMAFSSPDGLRWKAAVTLGGLVRPGARPDDDWFGLLDSVQASRAAQVIAWLETDDSHSFHGHVEARTSVLGTMADRPPGLDPLLAKMVDAPKLSHSSADNVTFTAWFLHSGSQTAEQWKIQATSGSPATIRRLPAGPGDSAAADARALRVVEDGPDRDRWWALERVAASDMVEAIPEVAGLLADPAASGATRQHAATTLARLRADSSVRALAKSLAADPAPEVRRAVAQALGRLGGPPAVDALAEAAGTESDSLVRFEIVHALAAAGPDALRALRSVAKSHTSAGVRELAEGYLTAQGYG